MPLLPRPFRQSAGRAGATHALGLGLLLTFSSSIGQTYFIALFAGALRADLDLSHGAFGGLYTLATLASALILVWLGKTADRVDPVVLAALTLAALAGSAMLLAGAESVLWLGIGLFGLRLFGQGMSSHLAMTFVARWFVRERGRALGLVFLLPLAAGLALLRIGDSIATAAGFMALMGATAGSAAILFGAVWAELYGTAHLGAIRALAVALQVLATALAPATLGWLIDQGIGLDRQAPLLSLLVCASALGLALLLPSLLRDHAPPAPRPT